MFMWKYFILYFGAGFAVGLSTKVSNSIAGKRPIDALYPMFATICTALIIWNFYKFGATWGLLSIIEAVVGIFVGRIVSHKIY